MSPCCQALHCLIGVRRALRACRGAGLPDADGEDRRAVRRRRPGRHLRPLPRPAAAGNPQAGIRDREPSGSRGDHRHRRGREVASRRLHAADDVEHPYHQRDAAPQQAVPADARFRGGGARQLLRPHHGRAPLGSGQGPEGVHRAAEGQARRPQLCLLGPRHALPHGGRAVQSHERHQHRARAAQGQRGSAHRRARRPRADDDRRHHHHGAHRAGRAGAGAGHDGAEALERPARCADHRRGRRARLRGHHLARHHGAGGHARSRRRQAQRRDQQGARAAPRPGRRGPSRAPSRSS